MIAKDSMLEKCHHKIEELHEKLRQLETENRSLLTQKSQEELERIQLKKQSLTLNLKNKTSDVQTDTLGLTASNGAQTTETETCDTFHTANSDCSFASALPSPFPPRNQDSMDEQQEEKTMTAVDINESSSNSTTTSAVILLPGKQQQPQQDDGKALMSDSGVCLENNNNTNNNNNSNSKVPEPQASSSFTVQNNLMKHLYDGDNLSTHSSQIYFEQLLNTQIDKLRERIAEKKAEIMRILETGGDKSKLDDMINELQELQKDFVKYEMRLDNSRGK